MIRSGYAVTEPSDSYILLRMLYAAFVFFILLRIGLNALILNQFINYTTIEGSTIEKIHPAFYGIGLVALAILFNYRISAERTGSGNPARNDRFSGRHLRPASHALHQRPEHVVRLHP
jgi:hypothetical protein